MATERSVSVAEEKKSCDKRVVFSSDSVTGAKENEKTKNGDVKVVVSPKKSRFALLGKIFRPWKWRRKKKSERIEKTAIDLERKISVRTSREELIRKGVIKERDEEDATPQQLDKVDEDKETEPLKTSNNGAAGEPVATVIEDIKLTDNQEPVTQSGDTGEPPTSDSGEADAPTSEVDSPAPVTDEHTYENVVSSSEIVVSASQSEPSSTDNAQLSDPSTNSTGALSEPTVQPAQPTQAPPPTKSVLIRFQAPMKDHGTCNGGYDTPPPVPLSSPPRDDDDDGGIYDNVPNDEAGGEPCAPLGYEEIPAKVPNLNLLPKKSALKSANRVGSQTRPLIKPRNVRVPVRVEESNENTGDYDNLPGDDSSSDDENIRYRDDEDDESWAAKVARKDSLARFLNNRPNKRELIDKNIIPLQTDEEKQEARKEIGTKLFRRLSLRPTQEELEQKNILHSMPESQRKFDLEEMKRTLVRKLSFRPTIEELKQRQIIQFSDYVEVTDAREYDRRADKPWTRLTPRDKAAIRKELNEFKGAEMDVHEDSRQFTRFHRP